MENSHIIGNRYTGPGERAKYNVELQADDGTSSATIKAFTAEDREEARVAAESDAYRSANYRAITLSAMLLLLVLATSLLVGAARVEPIAIDSVATAPGVITRAPRVCISMVASAFQ